MDEKILNAQIGDIVMVQHNSGSIYRCRILDIYYSRNDKNLPSPIDYIKFQLLSPKDGLDIFFANRDAIWAYCETPVTKFKVGDEIQFRYNVAWRRGKIQQCYADKDGQILYDIYPWDEMVKSYDGLIGYKAIPEMNVRPYTDYNKIPWECKDSIPVSTGVWDDFSLPIKAFNLLSQRWIPELNCSIGYLDTDSIKVKNGEYIKVKKEDNMNNRPRNHKFVRTNTKERKIKEVIFNGPATIIKWEPTMHDYANGKCKGDKTVSVCGVTDPYDKEKGFLLAVIKEFVDNQSYDNILRMMDSFNDEERK